jgi:hypothetical protein
MVPEVEASAAQDPPRRPRRWRSDLIITALFLLGGVWLSGRLWIDLHHRVLSSFPPDHYLFEFWISHTARVVTHFENPLFTTHLNAPLGVNVMANTATFGMTLPLVPITLLFGPQASFAAMVTLAPALTALCWYLLFSRRVTHSRIAAFVGGAFCGFAPGIVAQDNVHPNLAMQAAIPLIVWQVIRLRDREVPFWKPGGLLGLLVIYQFFINEELLLFVALALAVFVIVWWLGNKAEARAVLPRYLKGLAVGAVVALVAIGYPIYYQFAGPQHYHGFGAFSDSFGADLLSFTAFPTHSFAGGGESAKLAGTVVEETAFFGWPLMVMAVVWAAFMWRRAAVRAAAITGAIFIVLSLGAKLHVAGVITKIPGPWVPFARLPLLDSVITPRFALVAIPVMGYLAALTLEGLVEHHHENRPSGFRLLGFAGMAIALLPLVPTPFAAVSRPPVPAFIADGTWHDYVAPGQSLLSLPIPNAATGIQGVQWVSATDDELHIVGGYFLVPDTRKDDMGIFGPEPRPTIDLITNLALTGHKPSIGPKDRANLVADLRFWNASVIVLAPKVPQFTKLKATMTEMIGFAPTLVDGVWLWDARSVLTS